MPTACRAVNSNGLALIGSPHRRRIASSDPWVHEGSSGWIDRHFDPHRELGEDSMREINGTEVAEVNGGLLACSMLPPPANFVCSAAVAGIGMVAFLMSTDSNAGSTTNLSEVTAP